MSLVGETEDAALKFQGVKMNKDRISQDWKDWIPYPYKGYVLTNPQYIKDRDELFAENGNGWWWNEGRGWTMHWESPMEYQRRRKGLK